MIEATRLNGEPMVINSDLIQHAEANPDTIVTLITGDKIVVTESPAVLVERVIAFRARLLRQAFPEGPSLLDPGQLAAANAAFSAKTASESLSEKNTENVKGTWGRRQRNDD